MMEPLRSGLLSLGEGDTNAGRYCTKKALLALDVGGIVAAGLVCAVLCVCLRAALFTAAPRRMGLVMSVSSVLQKLGDRTEC